MIRPLWERVWSKTRQDPGSDCIFWTGATSKKRRGQRRPYIQIGRRGSPVVNVARLVCYWFHGEPPDGYEAGHTCPQGEQCLCINPDHLAWQTREENEQLKQGYRHNTPVEVG